MGDLSIDTAVTGADGAYSAFVNRDWEIWGPMGGYVASIALRAAAAEVDPALVPASFTCQFFSPAAFEEIDISVQVRRASRRTAAVSVDLTQDDRPVLAAQAWFAAESAIVEHDFAARHSRRGPEAYRPIQELTDEEPHFPFWRNFDTRPTDVSDWLLTLGRAPIAHRGLIAFRSEVWTADDRLAASGAGQLLVRAVPG